MSAEWGSETAPRAGRMGIGRVVGLALLLLLAGQSAGLAQVSRLHPVDEAVRRPDFFTFRAGLLQALQARDTTTLYSVLAPNILNSFGGDGGPAEFRTMWRPHDPQSELWAVLTRILALGGGFHEDSMFIAPYLASHFPPDHEGFDHVAVVGSNVRARAEPSVSSPVLATLSFEVLRRAEPSAREPPGWIPVRLASGETAFIAEAYVGSPTDRRAVFVRREGRWMLRALVAGD